METKKTLHLTLVAVLIAGTIFAWYNSAKDLGWIACNQVCGAGAAMLGLSICVWGAIFFTLALVLAVAMLYVKE